MNRRQRRAAGEAPVQGKGVIHQLVAQTAKEMCRCFYEEAAHDNDFYRKWPTSDDFLFYRWQSFVQPAREHLAELLDPSKWSLTTEDQRAQIHEALLKNAAVNPAQNLLH